MQSLTTWMEGCSEVHVFLAYLPVPRTVAHAYRLGNALMAERNCKGNNPQMIRSDWFASASQVDHIRKTVLYQDIPTMVCASD